MSKPRLRDRARALFERMGNGLEHAHLGELRPHEEKLEHLFGYRAEARVVVAVDEAPQREALDYAVELARREGMLLDVVHVSRGTALDLPPQGLIPSLLAAGVDFRITRRRGEVDGVLLEYARFRPDIVCIVSAVRDGLAANLCRQGVPRVVTVGDELRA